MHAQNSQMNPLQQASQQTAYPGNDNAGMMEQLGDDNVRDIPDQGLFTSDPRFHENLAKYMSDGDLQMIGSDLTDSIKNDDEARQPWLRVVTEGIEYLGIGNNRNRSAYSGKSDDLFAPTLLKSALQATAEIHTNIFPSSGFVQTECLGVVGEEEENHASRIKEMMNFTLNEIMEGYKSDKKQGLLWMTLEGSMFVKVYIDRLKNKPAAPYIRASDIIIDPGATSLEDADRISHYFTMSYRALEEQFNRGDWKRNNIELEDLQSEVVERKIDQKVGVTPTMDETNKYYAFYETATYLNLRGFEHLDGTGQPSGQLLPYIVTKDKNSSVIVAIYRNWEENDPQFRPKKYIIQHKYFTGFNIYGLGLFHLALGLAKAETKIQQQLIRAAELANAPSLLQSSGLRAERSQIDIKPGSINTFQTFDSNIQNAIMPLPFNEPSQVLMQFRDIISSAITDLSVARQINPGDFSGNMPAAAAVGILSTMHILENGLLGDLYSSFKIEFQLIYNLMGEWLPEEGYPFKVVGGDDVMMKSDFSPNFAIRPVLDPNVSSDLYKSVINQGIMELAGQNPELYDIREVHRRILTTMKVSDMDKILLPKQEDAPPPPQMDPISENKTVMESNPIKAYKVQDHASHTVVHKGLIQVLDAQMQADSTQDNSQMIAALKAHIQEHDTFAYVINMEMTTGIELPDDPTQIPIDAQNHIAVQAAQAVQQQAQQDAQQNQQIDPNQILMEENRIKEKEADNRAAEDQARIQFDYERLQSDAQNEQMKLQIQEQEIQFKAQQLEVERMKLELQAQEMQMRMDVEMAKIHADSAKADQAIESKAFDSTLRYQSEQERDGAKIASDAEKSALDAQSKAYSDTLAFEREQQRSQEEEHKQRLNSSHINSKD